MVPTIINWYPNFSNFTELSFSNYASILKELSYTDWLKVSSIIKFPYGQVIFQCVACKRGNGGIKDFPVS